VDTELTLRAITADREAGAHRLARVRTARAQVHAKDARPAPAPSRGLLAALREAMAVRGERRPA
jgi:hypothetical protein